jgi:cytochrome P450
LLAVKRYSPGVDLLSALVAIRDGADRLSEDELTSMALLLLLLAGHETTVNLIGTGVFTLLEHPAQLALLRAQPMRITQLVEEILRFEGPAQVVRRYAVEQMELGGVTIAAGDTVVPALLAPSGVNLSPSSSTDIPFEPPSLWRGLGYRHATPCLTFTR